MALAEESVSTTRAKLRDVRRVRSPEPSPRQQQALDFIRSYVAEHGSSPTVREIGRALGVKSTNAVDDLLCALERKGYIVRRRRDDDGGTIARSIVLAAERERDLPEVRSLVRRLLNAIHGGRR